VQKIFHLEAITAANPWNFSVVELEKFEQPFSGGTTGDS
jgi:hypothetical protein